MMQRVTLRMPDAQLQAAESAVERGEFPNRSAAIRNAVREAYMDEPDCDHDVPEWME